MPRVLEDIETTGVSIVTLGDFNPSIFQPLWLSSNDLMSAEETAEAVITLVSKKLSVFEAGGMRIHAEDDRLAIATTDPSCIPSLRDLAYGVLSLLSHTPVRAIGLNLDSTASVNSADACTIIGDQLAPKRHWSKILVNPGMREVMIDGKRDKCPRARVSFRVRPAGEKKLVISVNQHYQIDERIDPHDAGSIDEALSILKKDWASFVKYAQQSSREVIVSALA